MTSLLTAPSRGDARPSAGRARSAHPLLGGVVAAAGPLLLYAVVGVVGWFLSDAGAHGDTRDGIRAGAVAWLMGHGSGVSVRGVEVTLTPLLLSAVSAFATWRVALAVGEGVSGHGPTAAGIADGERDWTVPSAVGLFGVGYAVVAALTYGLAAGSDTVRSLPSVLGWVVLLTAAVALPAIAIGSGRAAIWAQFVPPAVGGTLVAAWSILKLVTLTAVALAGGALLLGLGEAFGMATRLNLSVSETVLYGLVSVSFLPNAVACVASWLLGPGFAVGIGTLVSPSLVVLGPLPLFPLLAALPGEGECAWGVVVVAVVPPLIASLAVAGVLLRRPTLPWLEAAIRGCGGGIVAGLVVAVAGAMAGGSAGPGRMQDVGPPVLDLLVHAITALGVGGLLGALGATWWARRRA